MMSSKITDFVARRLNSIIRQISEIENSKKSVGFERVEIVWNSYAELHQSILREMSDLGEFFPDYKPHDVKYADHLIELTKTKVRELADHFSLTLDIDKTESVPSTVITQNQVVSQTNVQTQ